VGEQADHKEESEVMGVPEGLEALLPDFVVGSGVHEQKNEEHKVASDAAGLGVMDLEGSLLSHLGAFHIEEVDVVGRGVDNSIEEHLVCDLSVEPDVLIGGEEPSQLWANDTDDIAEHWD